MENKNDYDISTFDYKAFKELLNAGDIGGLDYLEKTIIRDYKDRLNDHDRKELDYYEYIVELFYAVKNLNRVNDIYETSRVENNFKSDLYFQVRDLLFEEIGFNTEDLWK